MKPILNIENLTKVYGALPNQTRALNGSLFRSCRESFSVLWEAVVPANPRFSTVLQL